MYWISFLMLGGVVRAAKVVTLGDSYSSGAGIHKQQKNYDDEWCWAEYDTIPGGRYAFSRGLDHVVTACAGDGVNSTVGQWNDLQLRYPEEEANAWNGSALIVSTGGNSLRSARDEDFPEGIFSCLTSLRCDKDVENEIINYAETGKEVEAFLEQLSTEASQATVRVMGYPRFFNSPIFKCFLPGMSKKEADFFDDLGAQMNDQLIATVDAMQEKYPDFDIQYVDVRKYFSTGACFPFRRFRQVNGIIATFLGASFHPSQRGYNRSYQAFLDSLGIMNFSN